MLLLGSEQICWEIGPIRKMRKKLYSYEFRLVAADDHTWEMQKQGR